MTLRTWVLSILLAAFSAAPASADAILTASEAGKLCRYANVWGGGDPCLRDLRDARNVRIIPDDLLSSDAAQSLEAAIIDKISKSAAGSVLYVDSLYRFCGDVSGEYMQHGCRLSTAQGSSVLVIPRSLVTDKVRAAIDEQIARTVSAFNPR